MRCAPLLAARWLTPAPSELGLLGEELAAHFLLARGWRILGRRVATPHAEVDLVALDGTQLVCVEVKTGFASRVAEGDALDLRWRPGLRFDREQLERQADAGRYLARWSCRGSGSSQAPKPNLRAARIDLIEVFVSRSSACPSFLHHKDVATRL